MRMFYGSPSQYLWDDDNGVSQRGRSDAISRWGSMRHFKQHTGM